MKAPDKNGVFHTVLALTLLSNVGWLHAAAPEPAKLLKPVLKAPVVLAALAAPQGVTAASSADGVQLSWQAVDAAASYLVLRGTGAAPAEPAIASLLPMVHSFLDKGFNAVASYQIVAVAADGRRGASAVVAFQPPIKVPAVISRPVALAAPPAAVKLVPPPAVPQPVAPLPVVKTPVDIARPVGMASLIKPAVASSAPAAPATTALAITAMSNTNYPTLPGASGRAGETIAVQGSHLDGLTGVTLLDAESANGKWMVNPSGSSIAVTATEVTTTGFKFIVPPAATPSSYTAGRAMLVRVSKGSLIASSPDVVNVFREAPPQKITRVAQISVRSTGRVRITGVGFNGNAAARQGQVIGGYFGSGTPGSASNPLISVGNLSDTYAELWLLPTCDQTGILMLSAGTMGGSSEKFVLPDAPITVSCAKGTPTGLIVGSESSAGGVVWAQPGSSVTIRGTDLRFVTRVVDTQGQSYPFTYNRIGSGPSAFEQLSVSIPQTKGLVAQFFLENSLTDPVEAGSVTGLLRTAAAPTWYRLDPAWAEAGQKIWIAGHDLNSGAAPTVTVGGVAAQLLPGNTDLVLEARLGAGTNAGPIQITTPGGSVSVSGSFVANDGSTHPGFFVVSGPSVVQSIQAAKATLAYGDVLTVRGQNLARLAGICVLSSGQGGGPAGMLVPVRRATGTAIGLVKSNTEMQVTLDAYPTALQSASPIQMFAPNTPPGDTPTPPGSFSCQPNSASVNWTW